MLAAKNKFDAMVEKGTWNAPTAEKKIVALEAKLTSSMKTLNKKVSFEMMGKKGSGKAKSTGDKKRSKDDSEEKDPKTWSPPKAGDKKVAKYNGYVWYWCGKDTGGKCEKWRAHKPKECKERAAAKQDKLNKKTTSPKRQQPEGKKGKDSIAKKLKVAKAYVAKMEQKAAEMEITDEDSD
jgi:hypothetical protein